MLDATLAEKLKIALERLDYHDFGPITDELRIDELGIDSVALSELLALLEEDYDIDIDSEELFSVETFGELEALLKARE
ncbi:MAG: phosphopantetheine-binding protein [Vulcanimicrobiota bacterium]